MPSKIAFRNSASSVGRGSMRGIVSRIDHDPASLLEKVRSYPEMVGRDLASRVTIDTPYVSTGEPLQFIEFSQLSQSEPQATLHVVAYDFGIKTNIVRDISHCGGRVTVVPAAMSAEEVLKLNPDGVFLSNGPGDPEAVGYAAQTTRELLESKKPLFGICLGHQILGLALGGRTYKLKFGHHGGNQPVMDLTSGKVEITSQNHNFAVDVDSLAGRATLSHVNLNDRSVEGMRLADAPVFSVQYHPEASPGPHDASYLFGRFVGLMEEARR